MPLERSTCLCHCHHSITTSHHDMQRTIRVRHHRLRAADQDGLLTSEIRGQKKAAKGGATHGLAGTSTTKLAASATLTCRRLHLSRAGSLSKASSTAAGPAIPVSAVTASGCRTAMATTMFAREAAADTSGSSSSCCSVRTCVFHTLLASNHFSVAVPERDCLFDESAAHEVMRRGGCIQ